MSVHDFLGDLRLIAKCLKPHMYLCPRLPHLAWVRKLAGGRVTLHAISAGCRLVSSLVHGTRRAVQEFSMSVQWTCWQGTATAARFASIATWHVQTGMSLVYILTRQFHTVGKKLQHKVDMGALLPGMGKWACLFSTLRPVPALHCGLCRFESAGIATTVCSRF